MVPLILRVLRGVSTLELRTYTDQMDQTPDDIFALYSRFDLDGDHYRVFAKASPAVVPAKPVSSEGAAIGVSSSHPKLPERHAVAPLAEFDEATDADAYDHEGIHVELPIAANASRLGLRNLWQHVVPVADQDWAASAAALSSASLSIHAAAGGVGSTTIAAVLARLLSRSGRRCAIFDESEDSALPIYFGAHNIAADHRRFSGLYSVFEPGIKILNREMYQAQSGDAAQGAGFIERNIVQLAPHFDHLLFDQRARSTDTAGAGLVVYTAIPDVSSLIGVRKLKDTLQPPGGSGKAICVLNRFDSTVALHRELLGWYRESFANVVTIQQSPLVSEALAEGTTVVDWAPRTKVALDFLNLFKTVNHLLNWSGSADSNAFEPNQLEAKGLPLCS